MEKDNFILVSMDDPRAKKIAKVVGNKTAHKILNFLEENPKKSEQDIATGLKVPLNTVGYNIKQLLDSGLIEKTENFFWSQKGKKISLYQVSNKSVIFSPKKANLSSQIKSILPVSLLAGVGALVIRLVHPSVSSVNETISQSADLIPEVAFSSTKELVSNAELAGSGLVSSSQSVISLGSPMWWFVGGVLVSVIVFILVNSILRLEKNYSKIEHRREVKYEI